MPLKGKAKTDYKRVAHSDPFIWTSDDRLIPIRDIHAVDLSTLEKQRYITIYHRAGEDRIEGVQMIEALMQLKPSALEGRRMQWARQAWLLHNTFGHCYLAALSLTGLFLRPLMPDTARKMIQHGIYVHDATCPKPKAPA